MNLIDIWEEFINSCKDGYSLNYFDYQNDLTIRTEIETVKSTLSESELIRLELLDNIFRSICNKIDDKNNSMWWTKLIPKDLSSLWVLSENWHKDFTDLYPN